MRVGQCCLCTGQALHWTPGIQVSCPGLRIGLLAQGLAGGGQDSLRWLISTLGCVHAWPYCKTAGQHWGMLQSTQAAVFLLQRKLCEDLTVSPLRSGGPRPTTGPSRAALKGQRCCPPGLCCEACSQHISACVPNDAPWGTDP